MQAAKDVITNLFSGKEANKEANRVCEVCGNEYDKCFEVRRNGETHVFDSFECAIHALAPKCAHCGCQIIGHGMEANGVFYCCAHCASQEGVQEMEDRSPTEKERSPA
jgi:Rieske Fe-S protein